MKMFLKICLVAMCFAANVQAQELFQKKYNYFNEKSPKPYPTVFQTNDGGYISATTSGYMNAGNGILLLKTDKNGQVEWCNYFKNSANMMLQAMIQTSDEGFCLAGVAYFAGDTAKPSIVRAPALIKTDSMGNILWTKIYGDTLKGTGSFQSVIEMDNTDLFLAGNMYLTREKFIYKVNVNGELQWAKEFPQKIGDYIEKTHDGNIAVGGSGITKIDTAGNILWAKRYSADIRLMRRTNDSGFIAIGSAIMKINNKGDIDWSKRYSSGYATGIDEMYPGRYGIAGYSPYEIDGRREWCAVIDSSGDILKAIYPHYCCGSFFSMKRTQDSGFIAEGAYGILGDMRMYLLKVDKNGATSCPQFEVPMGITSISYPVDVSDTSYTATHLQPSVMDWTLQTLVLNDVAAADICAPTDVTEEPFKNEFQLFPNPASGVCTILLKEDFKNADISIIDVTGRTLYRKLIKMAKSEIKLDISPLQPGAYFVKVIADGREFMQKMIVE